MITPCRELKVGGTVTYDGDTVISKSTDVGYRCTSETFGNNLVRSISFGRQVGLQTNDKVSGIDELNFDCTYVAGKNVKSEINPSRMFAPLGFRLTYDEGNRVKSWNRVADYLDARKNQSWNYDAAGNWNTTTIEPSDGSEEITHQYDSFSRRVRCEFGNTDEVLLWWSKEGYAKHENIGSQPPIQNDLHANPTGLNTAFGRTLEGSKHGTNTFPKTI